MTVIFFSVFFFFFFKQLPAAVGDKVLDSCEIKPYIKFVKKTETIRAKPTIKVGLQKVFETASCPFYCAVR